ncbi:hypothetical protein FPL18_06395 [Acinetobacter gyllenbergii]|nr:hypothetical protein FPL18_06395 [Acinetobacter gyllenbergii]
MRKTTSSRRQKQIQKTDLTPKENQNAEVVPLNNVSNEKDGLNEELVHESNLNLYKEQVQTLAQIKSEQEEIFNQLKVLQENLATLTTLTQKKIDSDEGLEKAKVEQLSSKIYKYLDERINLNTIYEYIRTEINNAQETIIHKINIVEEKRFGELNQKIDEWKDSLKASQNDELVFRLKSENELILNQLNVVQEEVENLILEKKALKDIKNEVEIYYGAGDRVKEELPYRLGATMISHSHSLNGLLTLPLALITESSNYYRKEKEIQPPIEKYEDVYEAERVKQHLSYKLGSVMLSHSKTLKGWVNMPLAIHKEVKTFRKKQGK